MGESCYEEVWTPNKVVAVSLKAPSSFCSVIALSVVSFSPLLSSAGRQSGERDIQQDRRCREREWDRGRERKNVCVGARVRYRVSWDLFSWLSRSVSPPATSPVTHTHTQMHTHTHSLSLLKSHYISQEIEAFWKLSPVPLGYSQTRAPVTPPRSRAQFLSVGLSLLRQTPLSSETLHNHPWST